MSRIAIAMILALLAAHATGDDVLPIRLDAPKSQKVGGVRLSATPCSIDGDPLVYTRDPMQAGMVVTPAGDVVLIDPAGHLRRYRPRSATGCELRLDKTFGRGGVLELGPDATPKFASLATDRSGAIYVSIPKHPPLRVVGDRTDAMACQGTVRANASPRSDFVWRHHFASAVTRERGDCSDAKQLELGGWDSLASQLWVVDDRVAVYGRADGRYRILVYGPDGKHAGELPTPTPDQPWDPIRVLACGAGTCAVNYKEIAIWSARGVLLGTANIDSLLGVTRYVWPIDVAIGRGASYLLVRNNDPKITGDRAVALIVRIDGFPR